MESDIIKKILLKYIEEKDYHLLGSDALSGSLAKDISSFSNENLKKHIKQYYCMIDNENFCLISEKPEALDSQSDVFAKITEEINEIDKICLDSTEKIMNYTTMLSELANKITDAEQKESLNQRVVDLMSECGMQDLISQRIHKLSAHLLRMKLIFKIIVHEIFENKEEQKDLLNKLEGLNKKDPLMNGPQSSVKAMPQNDIDSFFPSKK